VEGKERQGGGMAAGGGGGTGGVFLSTGGVKTCGARTT